MSNDSDYNSDCSVVEVIYPDYEPRDLTKETGYHLEHTYRKGLGIEAIIHREIDFLRERVTQNAEGGISDEEIHNFCESVLASKPGSQSLVSRYKLASFNAADEQTLTHTSNSDVQSVQTIPRCHIPFENTAIRDEAEIFSQRHQTDHPTLNTAADWQKQLTRVSILARLYDVEQGKPVQHLCHVDRANDPPITTSDGLSKLETEVRDMESKLSGILFIGPCGTNMN